MTLNKSYCTLLLKAILKWHCIILIDTILYTCMYVLSRAREAGSPLNPSPEHRQGTPLAHLVFFKPTFTHPWIMAFLRSINYNWHYFGQINIILLRQGGSGTLQYIYILACNFMASKEVLSGLFHINWSYNLQRMPRTAVENAKIVLWTMEPYGGSFGKKIHNGSQCGLLP